MAVTASEGPKKHLLVVMTFLLIFVLICLFALPPSLGGEIQKIDQPTCSIINTSAKFTFPQIVLFGDSLTSFSVRPGGFSQKIHLFCERRCDLVVRGFGGYNTTSAKRIAPMLFSKGSGHSIKLLTILFGSNDAARNVQNVPLAEYQQNLHDLITFFTDYVEVPQENILLMCPPPVITLPLNDRTTEDLELYSEACEQVGKKREMSMLNLFKLFSSSGKLKYLLKETDGVHLSSRGEGLIAEELLTILKKRAESSFPVILPSYREIELLDGLEDL